MPKSKTHSYNVMLSPEDDKKLHKLQELMRCTGANVIRAALAALYSHRALECPCCADGNPCFVPQMHTPRYDALRKNADVTTTPHE